MEQIKEKYFKLKSLIEQRDINSIQKTINTEPKIRDILTYKDLQGRSLIFHAMFVPNEDFNFRIIDLFMSKGADPKDKEINKQSIIFYIAKDNKIKLLAKVLKFGFNLNDNDYMNQTPLFYTAKQGLLQVSQMLIQNGCDVNHKDINGQTCLFYAARSGNLEMCRLLAKYNCNMLHQDKSRVKASHYAKIQGHKQVVDYLNQFKYQAKKIKQDKRDSSLNQKKKKKQSSKNDYSLAYCNQYGQVIQLSVQQLIQFSRASQTNQRIFQMLRNPQLAQIQTQGIIDKKFQKTALKIMNYFWKTQNAHHFYEPVDYIRQNLQDYPKIVKYPMDFGTIKRKLTYNAYQSEDQFKEDMNLVFDNCILYNGMQSPFGKIAMQMKLQFNTMYIKELFSGNA